MVNRLHFGRLLVADSRLDDHDVSAGADDGGVEAEQDAIFLVGRHTLLPERFWNNAEHGSAIEQVGAIGADGQLEIAHGGTGTDEVGVSRLSRRMHGVSRTG